MFSKKSIFNCHHYNICSSFVFIIHIGEREFEILLYILLRLKFRVSRYVDVSILTEGKTLSLSDISKEYSSLFNREDILPNILESLSYEVSETIPGHFRPDLRTRSNTDHRRNILLDRFRTTSIRWIFALILTTGKRLFSSRKKIRALEIWTVIELASEYPGYEIYLFGGDIFVSSKTNE